MPWDLFLRSPVGIAVVSASGRILQTNATFDTLFGYQAEELLNRSIEELTPPEARPHHPGWRRNYLNNPTDGLMSRRRDLTGLTKQGKPIPIEVILTRTEWRGEPATIAWVLDQTERNEMDERFRLAIEGAPSGIIFVDEEGKIVRCNRQVCRDFGYKRSDLVGRAVEALTPQSAAAHHPDHRRAFLKDPQQRPMGHGRELFGRRKDGSEFPVEIGLTPIQTRHGKWTMASIVDISLRKKAEEDLQTQNQNLLDFVYSASHDLKAPLATIRGLVAIAQDDLEEGRPQSVREILTQVEQRAKKLSDLVDGTLALASSDRTEQAKEVLSPADLVGGIVEGVSMTAAFHEIRIDVSIPPEIRIKTSRQRLQLIIENLLRNAIKYHDPNKQDRFAAIRIEQGEQTLTIEVQDNGLGIPESAKDRVFEMFQRFHPERAEGSGLGLAMVKKQTLKLGGAISFQSSPAGTTFRVELPRQAP